MAAVPPAGGGCAGGWRWFAGASRGHIDIQEPEVSGAFPRPSRRARGTPCGLRSSQGVRMGIRKTET